MRDQTLIDTWSQLLVKWTEAHALDQKMTNHFVYDKAAPEHRERQEVDALWLQEEQARIALDDFIDLHAA